MGTDNLGRDVFSRVVYAARVDLQIGVIMTYVPLVTGVVLGAIAGYFGGWVDTLIMRLVDVVIAFPFLVLVIAIGDVHRGARGRLEPVRASDPRRDARVA